MSPAPLHAALKRLNRGVGVAVGVVLAATVAMILIEIVARRVAFGILGGTDEIAGYVMAGVVSWSAAFALIERAHLRIDLGHRRLPAAARTALDLLSLAVLLAVSLLVVSYGWSVVARSWNSGSLANTPLETPLWIPQAVWWAGWVWFALASAGLLLLTAWAAARGDLTMAAEIAAPDVDDAALADGEAAASQNAAPDGRP